MEFMTKEEFAVIEANYPYHKGRWDYHGFAIDLLKKKKFETALELGTGPCSVSVIKNADTMKKGGATYEHNATIIPWPIEDKKYDLFISFQTFEHLNPNQKEAFGEVIRISKSALLSFPHKWNYEDHDISLETMKEWTHNLDCEIYHFGNPEHQRNEKIFMYFEFGD